jgi:hypothetical protein
MKTSTLITLILLLGLAGIGCYNYTEKFVTTTDHDAFLGSTSQVMWGNTLVGIPIGEGKLGLNIAAIRQDKDSIPAYFLTAVWEGFNTLSIQQGPSLVLLANGVKYDFQIADSLGNRALKEITAAHLQMLLDNDEYHHAEIACYPASLDTLNTIASADSVRVKLFGDNGSPEASFTQTNLQRFKDFLKSGGASVNK